MHSFASISNYAERKLSWIYFSGTLDAATWGAELAKGPKGRENARERIYIVEPTAEFEDDPNLTDSETRADLPLARSAARSR